MTIFHVLKYPISTPPTLEQLQALPTDLLQSWAGCIGWSPLTPPSRIQFWTYHWLRIDNQHMEEAEQDLELLRKMISEYEE